MILWSEKNYSSEIAFQFLLYYSGMPFSLLERLAQMITSCCQHTRKNHVGEAEISEHRVRFWKNAEDTKHPHQGVSRLDTVLVDPLEKPVSCGIDKYEDKALENVKSKLAGAHEEERIWEAGEAQGLLRSEVHFVLKSRPSPTQS